MPPIWFMSWIHNIFSLNYVHLINVILGNKHESASSLELREHKR